MTTNALNDLKSDEFRLALGVVSGAPGMRRCLQKSPLVRRLRGALKSGEISEARIRRFVGELSSQFCAGTAFFHEPALAAIAVAMESWNTPFADDYLRDLSRLDRIAEFHMAPLVAGLCRHAKRRDRGIQRQKLHAIGTRPQPNWRIRELTALISHRESNHAARLHSGRWSVTCA